MSLYDLSVLTFLQTTRAMAAILNRTTQHCAALASDPDDFVCARLYPDMAPLHFQIETLRNHSVWGLEAVRTGEFTPPPLVGAGVFAELQSIVGDAIKALETFTREEVDSWSGKTFDIVVFRPVDEHNASTSPWAGRTLPFTSETFLLSYSVPNFYFHAVTAYNILRARGVPIGKGDYEGRLRS